MPAGFIDVHVIYFQHIQDNNITKINTVDDRKRLKLRI